MSKLNTLTDEEIVPSIARSTKKHKSLSHELDFNVLSTKLKQYLVEKCTEYVGNDWKGLDLTRVTIKRLTAGTSNIIYTVTNNSCSEDDSFKTVLVRLYGKFLMASFRNQLKDAVVFTILSERSLGPKLHGIFEYGRVEEYITSRGLTPFEIRSPPILSLVAARMAQIHNLKVPIFKSPRFLIDTMQGWLEEVNSPMLSQQFNDLFSPQELDWLQDRLLGAGSLICFCHNDLQAGNILLKAMGVPQSPDDLLVIDYEYCSYNYRDYDLANFFAEWAFEYSIEHTDGFLYRPENVPTCTEKIDFIKSYIKYWNHFSEDSMDDEDIETFLENVRLFELASHLFWSLWSLRQSQSSSIGFGYEVYARVRTNLYIELKEYILSQK